MVENSYVCIRPNQSSVVWTNLWQPVHVKSLPSDGVCWAFTPDIGNDDEGYGYVMLARYRRKPFAEEGEFRTVDSDEVIEPAFWATLMEPEPLFTRETKEEAIRAATSARDDVINQTGPFAR